MVSGCSLCGFYTVIHLLGFGVCFVEIVFFPAPQVLPMPCWLLCLQFMVCTPRFTPFCSIPFLAHPDTYQWVRVFSLSHKSVLRKLELMYLFLLLPTWVMHYQNKQTKMITELKSLAFSCCELSCSEYVVNDSQLLHQIRFTQSVFYMLSKHLILWWLRPIPVCFSEHELIT